jgi:hypothetical protein
MSPSRRRNEAEAFLPARRNSPAVSLAPRPILWTALLALVLIFGRELGAQKAEPLRIKLSEGTASVQGKLRGRQQTEYEAEGSASKSLALRLTAAPPRSVALKLYSPDGAELALRGTGTNRWTAELPQNGDYGISVLRTSPAEGTSTYKLTLQIH